jgi:hypothetical protein
MPTVSLSGNDSVTINNRLFADFADGDSVAVTFPTDIMNLKTGKNGNSLYAMNASGRQADVSLRLVRGSADDKFLNELLSQQQESPETFVLMIAQLTKKIGDGQGNLTNDTYILSGGVFSKQVEVKSNVEGDIEQSVSVYNLKFSNSPRVIG